jgi:hypothetical protein
MPQGTQWTSTGRIIMSTIGVAVGLIGVVDLTMRNANSWNAVDIVIICSGIVLVITALTAKNK